MKLIIAEKPVLAKAIAAAIPGNGSGGRDYTTKGEYTIVSAFGHLLTLKDPEDYDAALYRKWELDKLPIYFPNWGKKPGEGKSERLALIGELLKQADCVIHAGDPDDEGQYLIDEILQWFDYRGPVYRLATGDTTEGALRKALSSMTDNNDHVNAGWSAHARSVADIMVGYNFSRYFTLKNPKVKLLSIGRVQTPTLGLVVARDYAIENHLKQLYYQIFADLTVDGRHVTASYEPSKTEPTEEGKLVDRDRAMELADSLRGMQLKDIKVTEKTINEQPPLPFNLVKLQTYCSNRFGYDPSQTLAITQELRDRYNAITYNRSDCQYLSEEQFKEAPATVRRVLENVSGTAGARVFGRLPIDTKLHSRAFDDKNITAHTAIIPQNKQVNLAQLTEEQRNVYLAICKYYMAQFLPPAEKRRTSLLKQLEDGAQLKASSTEVLKPGYLELIRPEKGKQGTDDEEEKNELSLLKPGNYAGSCESSRVEEKETKAPPRYTKASLNEDMTRIARYVTDPTAKQLLLNKDKDKKGENGSIGTSATRASIIDILEERGYIESHGKQIISTTLGRELCRILPDELKKPDMTGYWWAVQESIQEGTEPWTALTDSVLGMIQKVVTTEYPAIDLHNIPAAMRRGPIPVGICPRCGQEVIEGERGFGCSGYKQGCKFVIWKKAQQGMMSRTTLKAEQVKKLLDGPWTDELRPDEAGNPLPTGKKRSTVTLPLKTLYSANKKTTYAGNVYLTDDGPDSPFGAGFALESLNTEREVVGTCPRCGGNVEEKKSAFFCENYDTCRFAIWKKQRQTMLANVTMTKTDAKKLLAGKSIHKKKLLAKNKTEFEADLIMEDTPENPYGPVFRVVEAPAEAAKAAAKEAAKAAAGEPAAPAREETT